jgi:quinol monooxygenase YgiN
MYGTVARFQVKDGAMQNLIRLQEEWNRERRPKVPGAVAGYGLIPDGNPNQVIVIAVFEDKASYFANAQDPEQDRWYQRVRALLTEDPTWEDGEIVAP